MSTTTNTGTNTATAKTASLPAQSGDRGASDRAARARTAALLDAGAILPAGTTDRDDADALTARTYTHTALGDRPLVRLVPGTLGEAEDLALEFLGLARTEEAPVVGQVRRETLGFPAWALVNDPANGHHALALVKDIERLGRQAKSRAGAAKEGFDELGTRLGRAVPHFLPTYYEQVARLFLQAENVTYAASFFGKAREAERVHGLVVDEDRQRAVFLEFALVGALTVKALRQYVRDLVARLAPEDAWSQFRRLLVERCAAGMPPYAALPQDVRTLVKAAGLDRESAERELVADLVGSPGVVRAPGSFWSAYGSALTALARTDESVRARLLGFFPETFGEDGQDTEGESGWLGLLAASGAEDMLTSLPEPATSDSAAPDASVSPADWLARWEAYRRRNRVTAGRSPRTLDLVTRMADRLRADGRPVDLFQGRWQRTADLDLLDLCLASGVPVADPDDEGAAQGATRSHGFAPGEWLTDEAPGRRDLTAVVGHPEFRDLLRRNVGDLGHSRGRRLSDADMAKLASHPVLSVLLREWLTARAEEYAAARGIPGLRTAFNKLSPFRSVVADVAPDAARLLEQHDVVPLLAATLRTGVFDELGWPALDETYDELAAEIDAVSSGRNNRSQSVGVTGAWPALILNTPERAVVVGPEGVLLRHTLRLPATTDRWRTPAFRYVDGELLVIWWEDDTQRGYWSHRPAEVFTVAGDQVPRWGRPSLSEEVSVPLPGGGRATGGKALHAGDTTLPAQRAVLSDGTGLWRDGHEGTRQVWLEYDPATGTHGRASLPAFLRSGTQDGTRLLAEHCQVLPLQPGLETTPFGTDGAILGRWVRRTDTQPGTAAPAAGPRTVVGTPDGHTVALPHPLSDGSIAVPLGALTLPGGSRPVAVLRHRFVEVHPADTDGTACLWSVGTDSSRGGDAAGTPYVPSVAYWHALRPRDERGSAALRKLTDDRAQELHDAVATAVIEHAKASRAVETYTGPSGWEMSEEAVARVLPEVSDARLRAGVTAVAWNAVDRAVEVIRYLDPPAPARPVTPQDTARTKGMFFDHEPEHGDDTTLREATAWGPERMRGSWWGGGGRWTAIRQILAVNHVFGGEPAFGPPTPTKVPFTPVDGWQRDAYTVPGENLSWTHLLDRLPELAYRAASEATAPGHRAGLLVLLEALAVGPLADPAGTVRRVELIEPLDTTTPGRTGRPEAVHRLGHVLRKGPRTVVILADHGRHSGSDSARWLALDHDPTGAFGPVPGFTLDREHVLREGIAPDRLVRLTALVREKGAAPWRPEAAEAFHAATGIGPLQATALLSAAIEEPGAEALAVLGAKTRAFEAAQNRLDALPRDDRHTVLKALLPADPAELWTTGPDVRAAAEVWRERLGSLVRVPEELDLDLTGASASSVDLVLNTGSRPWLAHGTPVPGSASPALHRVSGRGAIVGAVTALRTLAYTLPYAHPLRAHLPVGLAALRNRLADPGLVLDLGLDWSESGASIGTVIREAHGLPESGGADSDGLVRAGTALLLAPGYGESEKVLIRPAGLTGPDDPAFGLVEGTVSPHRTGDLLALRALLSEETAALAAAGAPDGSEPRPAQDPTRTAPELVAEAADVLSLSADAAALYLMLLALPDPTDRNCVRWTEWKPARVKKARAELAATDLVVEAKRSRAGRTLFLPCGWLERGAPGLPLETWKEGLYPVAGSARTLPHLAVPALYAAAWARVRGGDAPAFEELDTRATRKGRRR
ncbi:hypothetical protein ACFY8V_20145 [Streptomyces californicus]|uniref:hypothetical protein n=1 Tax=Streptomyces californicus TaxID=67351 RepID=UPI0036C4792A